MKQFRLPSLLGPLLLGIILRNIDVLNIFIFFQSWETRDCAKYNKHKGNVSLEKCEEEATKSSGMDQLCT